MRRSRPWAECAITASKRRSQRAGGRAAAPAARQDVVGGQHERAPARQQRAVERRHGEPLEVHEVGGGGVRAVAQHVGHVLARACPPGARALPGAPSDAR